MQLQSRWFIILLLFGLISCENKTQDYPVALNKAIGYFYTENKNDSVLFELSKPELQNQSQSIQSLCDVFKAAALCEKGQVDSASVIFWKIQPDPNDRELFYWYESIKGLLLFRQDKIKDSYTLLLSAISLKPLDTRALALNERLLARILFTAGEDKNAIEWMIQSNRHFEESGLPKSIAVNQKILGRHFMTIKNNPEAFKCFKSAENLFVKYNDKAELFYIYINLIDYFINLNNLDKAAAYAVLCLKQCNDVADNTMRAVVYNNLGEIKMNQHRYDEAIQNYTISLQLPEDNSDIRIRQVSAHINLSKIYKLINNSPKSRFHALMARDMSKSESKHLLKYKMYRQLADSYADTSSRNAAYNYLDTATVFLDSAFQSISATSKAFYDTKANLLSAGIKLDQLQLKEKRNKNKFLFTTLSLLVIIISTIIISHLQHLKNNALHELVKKNMQIIEEERKYSASLRLRENEQKRYKRKPTDSEKSDSLFSAFSLWIETEKRFTKNDLTLEMASKELNTNREYLSRAINEHDIHFTDLINKYLVLEAIRILSDFSDKKSKYNLLIIANEVGFNSNSSFIEAFRKQTGMTPAQFRQNITSSENI